MHPPVPMPELLERIGAWLVRHRPRFLAGLRAGATAGELTELEKALNEPVPESLRTLLAWHNGQGDDYIGYFEDHWLLMGTKEIAATRPMLVADAAKTGWEAGWIPFMDDDGGDYLALEPAIPGCPVRAFWLGHPTHHIIRPTLEAWLGDFVDHLERGAYQEDPERGTLERASEKKALLE